VAILLNCSNVKGIILTFSGITLSKLVSEKIKKSIVGLAAQDLIKKGKYQGNGPK
jgi:hypothetical protein